MRLSLRKVLRTVGWVTSPPSVGFLSFVSATLAVTLAFSTGAAAQNPASPTPDSPTPSSAKPPVTPPTPPPALTRTGHDTANATPITINVPSATIAAPSAAPAGVPALPPPPPGATKAAAPPTAPAAAPASGSLVPSEPAASAAAPTPVPAGPVGPVGPALPLERVVAVVGDQPVLWSRVLETINVRRAQGLQVPQDSAAQAALVAEVTNELIDEELLVQKAKDLKVDVADEDVASGVDAQIKRVRTQFSSDAEYKSELKKAGFGTPEEYRKGMVEQAKRGELQKRVIEKLKQDGKLIPVNVTERDVAEAFERNKDKLPKRPASITFRQIVIAPRPSAAAKAVAHARADTILSELKHGAAFAELAKRESQDPGSRETGGDLGWNRRGNMVPEFDRWMFALPPGQLSPVIETTFGFHIIRVDRVRPGEVKAGHILIKWKIDSASVAAAKLVADSALTAWKAGANFDTLVARYHDSNEEKGSLQPFPRDSLPPSYSAAFAGEGRRDYSGPFAIPDKTTGAQKYVIAQILDTQDGGEFTVADLKQTIRDQLQQERSIRRLLDGLRKDTYVSVRLEQAGPPPPPRSGAGS